MDLFNYSVRRGLRLSSARFLLATDYFDAFIDKHHSNFSTSVTRSVSELLNGVLGSGSVLEDAPNDFITHWVSGAMTDVQLSGRPQEILAESLRAFGDKARMSGRIAVKFPIVDSIEDFKQILSAESGQNALSESGIVRSPKHYTAHLCHENGIYFEHDLLEGISVSKLSFGTGLLRTPAWQDEPRYGVLLLEIDTLPHVGDGLSLETAEVFSNSEMRQIIEDLESDRSYNLPFVNRWRLDNYGHEKILRSHPWKKGQRVLDVGCGYSALPKNLLERHNVEMWAADDPAGSGWARDFTSLDTADGSVKYVCELIGNPEQSQLPDDYFDVVYTKLGAHFAPHPQDNVWQHMAQLLRKRTGSELILIVGLSSSLETKPDLAMDILDEIGCCEIRAAEIVASGEFDPYFWGALDGSEKPSVKNSPYLYCAYIMNALGVSGRIPNELKAVNYLTNPDSFYDSFMLPALRACLQRDLSELQAPATHTGAMFLKFRMG